MLSGVSFNDRDSDKIVISSTASYFEDAERLLSNLTTLVAATTLGTYSEEGEDNNTFLTWLELQAGNATSNGVNSTEVPYTPYNLRPETYIVPIIFAIIFIVGVLGNGTLVIVFLKHRTMRNVPNT